MTTNDQADIIDLVQHLGASHGVGSVTADGRAFDAISYFLEVSLLGNGVKRIDGMIDAKLAVLDRISKSAESVLTLASGEQVPIIVAQARSGHAEIRIIGPMPVSFKLDDAD